jgi:hypothetical protein
VNTSVARLRAELGDVEWDLEQTVTRAPGVGFVTQVALRPGVYVVPAPLRPVMDFVNTDAKDQALGAAFQQNLLRIAADDANARRKEYGRAAILRLEQHDGSNCLSSVGVDYREGSPPPAGLFFEGIHSPQIQVTFDNHRSRPASFSNGPMPRKAHAESEDWRWSPLVAAARVRPGCRSRRAG